MKIDYNWPKNRLVLFFFMALISPRYRTDLKLKWEMDEIALMAGIATGKIEINKLRRK